MKTKWKIVLLLERKIEFEERMVNMPFVKLKPEGIEGDAFFAVPGGVVKYAPEKVDLIRSMSGTVTEHVSLKHGDLIESITALDGTVWNHDGLVELEITSVE